MLVYTSTAHLIIFGLYIEQIPALDLFRYLNPSRTLNFYLARWILIFLSYCLLLGIVNILNASSAQKNFFLFTSLNSVNGLKLRLKYANNYFCWYIYIYICKLTKWIILVTYTNVFKFFWTSEFLNKSGKQFQHGWCMWMHVTWKKEIERSFLKLPIKRNK